MAPLILLFSISWALPHPAQAPLSKQNRYLAGGVVIGGQHRPESSLLGLQLVSKASAERLTLSLGDGAGAPLKGALPFFHLSVLQNRLVLDLDQVQRTRVELAPIQKALKASRWIQSCDFTMDPEDGSSNLTLRLKKPVEVEVFQLESRGQLVLDIREKGVL